MTTRDPRTPRRLTTWALPTVALLATGCVMPDSGDGDAPTDTGAAIVDNQTVRIIADHSGLALDVTGSSRDNGAVVSQYGYWKGPNQRWKMHALSSNTFEIRNINSDKCLEIFGDSQEAGARVDQWECRGGKNQQWKLRKSAAGTYEIASFGGAPNLCMDVEGASTDLGAAIKQFSCWGGKNQLFRVEPVDANGATKGDGSRPLPALPLRTQGRFIVDAKGARFKLASVNWYGAESSDHVVGGLHAAPLADLARRIREMGFNSVRLPWSNELVEQDPIVEASLLAKNPDLVGKRGLEILDAVIEALAKEGLVVVLDNHVSRAAWCCSDTDGNGLWYSDEYPESLWLKDWTTMVKRYKGQPAVVGAELRNELRSVGGVSATWGGEPSTDWHAAAMRGGEAVLAANPDLLVVVGGLSYNTDFRGAYMHPPTLSRPNRLVYAVHDYAWFHTSKDFASVDAALGDAWGFLLTQGKPFTAPVWVSEFGTCNTAASCVSSDTDNGLWFQSFSRYLTNADIDWAYWALNGTQSTGEGRTYGDVESYGLLNTSYSAAALPELLTALKALQPATQR